MSQVSLLWDILSKHDISDEDALLIYSGVQGLRADVAIYLLGKAPSKETLRVILRQHHSLNVITLVNVAKHLLGDSPSNEELIFVLDCCSREERFWSQCGHALWEKLLGRNPTPDQLRSVAECEPRVAEEAWEIILDNNPTNDDLCSIMATVDSLKDKAWEMLKKQHPTKQDLHWIIREVTALESQARIVLEELRNSEPDE